MATKFCPRCGAPLDTGVRFCSHCGKAVSKEKTKVSSGKNTKFTLLIAAILVIGLLGGARFLFGGSDRDSWTGTGATSEGEAVLDSGIIQIDNLLMQDRRSPDDFSDPCVLGSELKRSEVCSITFLDSLSRKGENAWDVSANQNGSVMAWTEGAEDGYDLFIAGEGGVSAPEDCSQLFSEYSNVEYIQFGGNFDTKNTTKMLLMFSLCEALCAVDVETLNTSDVTDMSSMFLGCRSLQTLDVSDWNTGNVDDMFGMFKSCESLETLDVGRWDTGEVTNMTAMFSGCRSLETLDVSGWNTGNVCDMFGMFENCESLETLDVGGWDTGKVTRMSEMFMGCKSLVSLPIEGWDTGSVEEMDDMLDGCDNLIW